MSENGKDRHPFRFLFKFALVVGFLALITKVVASKKEEYYGITESEARMKFESKLGPRIGEDKATEIADQVIPKLKEKGIIVADPVEDDADTTEEADDSADEDDAGEDEE